MTAAAVTVGPVAAVVPGDPGHVPVAVSAGRYTIVSDHRSDLHP